jgi:WhiB family redox-sensing transcriptional regulator
MSTTRDPQTRHERPPRHERQTLAMNTISTLPEPDLEPDEAVIQTVGPRCADGNGTLTPLFFSDDLVDIARAKAMCTKCPLRANCLRDALDREEPWGVWGGELLLNGRIVTSKRPCGRPPKRPRPALVIDELGPVVEVA